MTDDLTCQELVELLSMYLDAEGPPRSLQQVAKHLSDCLGCQAALDHLQASIDLTGNIEVKSLSPEVRQRLLEQFREIR